MIDKRQGREIGEALAFMFGDFRDEPLRCGWRDCHSEKVEFDHMNDAFACRDCGRLTSGHVASEDQRERMRARVMGGVGASLVTAFDRTLG